MKKIWTILFLVSCTLLVHAQGNLQFNRVVTYADSTSVTTPATGAGYIPIGTPVPINKVWKIEAFSVVGITFGLSSVSSSLAINGVNLSYTNGASSSSGIGNAPIGNGSSSSTIWLKANDILQVSYWNNSGSTTGSVRYFLSIIEFNIVP